MEERFIKAFKEALELRGEVKTSDTFRDYPEWDSLSRLSLIAMLDAEFKVQIESEAFDKLKTVGEILAYIQAKQS